MGAGAAANRHDQVDEEENLGKAKGERVQGHVDLRRVRAGQKRVGRGGDAGELGVVAGLAGQPGEVHGEKGAVGGKKGEPEVPFAEALGKGLADEQGRPVIRGAEQAEHAGHGHDEMEMRDDEERVVEVLIQDGLGEDRAGEAAGNEERDEAEGEEHGRGEARARAPDGGQPAEDFGGGGDGDGQRSRAEGGAGEGVEAGDEHVVSPDEDAEQADE